MSAPQTSNSPFGIYLDPSGSPKNTSRFIIYIHFILCVYRRSNVVFAICVIIAVVAYLLLLALLLTISMQIGFYCGVVNCKLCLQHGTPLIGLCDSVTLSGCVSE